MNRSTLGLVLTLFLYSMQLSAKTVVISDIDDTIKQANSVGKSAEQVYHFLKKVPYIEMRDLFNEIKAAEVSKSEAISFYYVSAAYSVTFKAQDWLQKNHFPLGRATLKTLKTRLSTYDFKHKVIQDILSEEIKTLDQGEKLHVLMFGDNSQIDDLVYTNLTKEMSLDSDIYIRDVKTEATFFDSSIPVKKLKGAKYYFSEVELFNNSEFNFLSSGLKNRAYSLYKNEKLIPRYTLKTLSRRLASLYNDKIRSHDDALKFWHDYHNRF